MSNTGQTIVVSHSDLFDRDREGLWEVIRCLLQESRAKELLARLGVHPDDVARCLARFCRVEFERPSIIEAGCVQVGGIVEKNKMTR